MRWRILQSTLIAVAITGLVLGGPLAFASWRLVEHATRADLRPGWRRWWPGWTIRFPARRDPSADLRFGRAERFPPAAQLVVDSPRTGHR